MNPLLIPVIASLATKVLDRLIASPETTVTRADSAAVKQEVAEAVAPVIEHLTNNEPWYQSRVTWGAIIGAASPMIAPLLGRELFSEEEQMLATAVLTGIGSAIGAGTVLYGRWKAKRPIGS